MNLRVVDGDTGEELPGCPQCERARVLLEETQQAYEDQIAGLQRDIRGWTNRYADLKRDKEQDAKRDPLWPQALRLFWFWQKACNHPNSAWDADRFYLAKPFLARKYKLGERQVPALEMCERAIAGAAHDCFKVKRDGNGTVRRFDEWERIFKNTGQFEEFVNKAPLDFVSTLQSQAEIEAERERLKAAAAQRARSDEQAGQGSLGLAGA